MGRLGGENERLMRRGGDREARRLRKLARWWDIRGVVEVLAAEAQIDDTEVSRQPFLRSQHIHDKKTLKRVTYLEWQLIRQEASDQVGDIACSCESCRCVSRRSDTHQTAS